MLEEGSGRDVYLPGRQKWIDYQTGKVYAPGWNQIERGTLPIVILVKDGSAIPHIPVAQCLSLIHILRKQSVSYNGTNRFIPSKQVVSYKRNNLFRRGVTKCSVL